MTADRSSIVQDSMPFRQVENSTTHTAASSPVGQIRPLKLAALSHMLYLLILIRLTEW